MIKYAGIGSRQTPQPIVNDMVMIGSLLGAKGMQLRSGKAARTVPHVPNTDSADLAFERGCDAVGGAKVIRVATLHPPALAHAENHNALWSDCSEHLQGVHASRSQIICGDKFDDPVQFVVMWSQRTGQIERIAAHYNIPVFNLATCTVADLFKWLSNNAL